MEVGTSISFLSLLSPEPVFLSNVLQSVALVRIVLSVVKMYRLGYSSAVFRACSNRKFSVFSV